MRRKRVGAERLERRTMRRIAAAAVKTDVFDIVSRLCARPPIVMTRFSEFPSTANRCASVASKVSRLIGAVTVHRRHRQFQTAAVLVLSSYNASNTSLPACVSFKPGIGPGSSRGGGGISTGASCGVANLSQSMVSPLAC